MCQDSLDFIEKVCETVVLPPVASVRKVVEAYTGHKRNVYEQAERKYWTDGVTKADATLRSFVKHEKGSLLKAPRCINPRAAVFNLALGRYLKFAEKAYYSAIAEVYNQECVVFKGYDTYETARRIKEVWDKYDEPIGIGGDAEKFDMHVSYEALYMEHLFYLRPYSDSLAATIARYDRVIAARAVRLDTNASDFDQLAWLLSQQLENVGTAYFDDGKLKFKMRGTRSSGDLNTSLGNVLLMCTFNFSWMRQTGVQMSLINNGDDCQYVMDAKDELAWRTGLEPWYRGKGISMVLEPTAHHLEEVEFCQGRPVETSEGWTMVRNPVALVAKGSMCLLPVEGMAQLKKWMMAVGVCEGSLARGVPVISRFAAALRRNGRRCSNKDIARAYYQSTRAFHADMDVREVVVTDAARLSFHAAWGITPDEQQVLERMYDAWRVGDTLASHSDSGAVVQHPVNPCSYLLSPAI